MAEGPAQDGISDVLGGLFAEVDIYDHLGVHVAFTAERRGDSHVFRATVQNSWNDGRRLVFAVTPERQSGADPKLSQETMEADLGPGEVGCLELTVPIPTDAFGRYRFFYSLRSRGPFATRCRQIHRKPLPSSRINSSGRIALALTGGIAGIIAGSLVGSGVFSEVQIEKADRPRKEGLSSGNFRSLWKSVGALPSVTPPAKAPMSPERRRNVILSGVMVALFLALSFAVGLWIAAHPTVFLVNALDSSVSIRIAEVTTTVPAKSVRKVSLPIGSWNGIATDESGGEIDRATIKARLPYGYVVWNISGAAPVYLEEFRYGSSWTRPRTEFYCGRHLEHFALTRVNYAFEEPPQRGRAGTTKTHLGVLDMNDETNACP